MADEEKVHKYLAANNTVRVSSVVATRLVGDICSRVKPSPVGTIALGRAIVGSALMASHLKNEQIALSFEGNGPIGRIYVEANNDGSCRANLKNPNVHTEPVDGKLDIGSAVGIGVLTVTRSQPFQKKPYVGSVMIKTGEIGDDIAFYLQQSHQIPSIVSLSVQLNEYGGVLSAGGVIVELMPGHTEEDVKALEKNVAMARNISEMLSAQASALDLAEEYLKGFELLEIASENRLHFYCPCTKERVLHSLSLLGEGDLTHILSEDKMPLNVECDFCSTGYDVEKSELEEILNEVKKLSLN